MGMRAMPSISGSKVFSGPVGAASTHPCAVWVSGGDLEVHGGSLVMPRVGGMASAGQAIYLEVVAIIKEIQNVL